VWFKRWQPTVGRADKDTEFRRINVMRVAPDVVATARRLTSQIVAAREETERLRQVPTALSNALATAGLYQMHLPHSMGGPELPPLTVFEAIEEISKADGSVGWCLMNANLLSIAAGGLAPEVGRRNFGAPPDIRAAGALRPMGRARTVEGGYRLKGHWDFASGLPNANWLYCPSLIMDGEASRLTPAGTPVVRVMWVPAAVARLIDNWSVMGMRGTGSHDFEIDDVFIPEHDTFSMTDQPAEPGPLYHPRFFITFAHLLFAANALGIARGAIDTLIDMASRKTTTTSTDLLRDRPLVQGRVAQAEAIASAARGYVIESLRQLWEAALANLSDPSREIGRLRLAIPHAIHESARAIDLVFHAAGTNAIFTANPLERQFRDIHVAVQHASAFPKNFESAGKVLMGLRPTDPGW
jgi:alkylation response protein AidB-like acyl-CoA dehydrogenase